MRTPKPSQLSCQWVTDKVSFSGGIRQVGHSPCEGRRQPPRRQGCKEQRRTSQSASHIRFGIRCDTHVDRQPLQASPSLFLGACFRNATPFERARIGCPKVASSPSLAAVLAIGKWAEALVSRVSAVSTSGPNRARQPRSADHSRRTRK